MPPKSLTARVLGAAIAVLSAGAPSTAEISVEPSVSGAPARILINGPMNWDVADKFIQQADAVSNAIVVFNSEGGDLLAALIIGRTIHQKKFYHWRLLCPLSNLVIKRPVPKRSTMK